jgi:hypothetical protein
MLTVLCLSPGTDCCSMNRILGDGVVTATPLSSQNEAARATLIDSSEP